MILFDHFTLIEADFRRFYLIDLPEALWGGRPMSGRRFAALLMGLPIDSAVATKLRYLEEHGVEPTEPKQQATASEIRSFFGTAIMAGAQ